MSSRIDYYDDPAAPIATSLVPAANVAVINDVGEVVMIRRGDNDNWAIPGGSMELGESLLDTARREVLEETGLRVEITGLVGLFTNPRHVIETDNAVRQEFSVVFTARRTAGRLSPSEESPEVRWMTPDAIATLPMDRSMRIRIGHYLTRRAVPYLG